MYCHWPLSVELLEISKNIGKGDVEGSILWFKLLSHLIISTSRRVQCATNKGVDLT